MRRLEREGYSLVELMITMAITSIVLGGLIMLLSFGARNVRLTQARVALQNQAKDAINHISTYVMEASDIQWDAGTGVLTIVKDKIGLDNNVESTERFLYWKSGKGIYFARESEVDPAALTADKKHLLLSDTLVFNCEVRENSDTERKILHVVIDLSDEDVAEFKCEKDIFMRNQ